MMLLVGMSTTPSLRRTGCSQRGISDAVLDSLATQLERARGHQAGAQYNIVASCSDVTYRGHRLAAVLLTDDGSHLVGGIAFLPPNTAAANAYVYSYPGAEDPTPAGPQRFGFTYQTGRGSGVRETTFVVLCGIAEDNWIECYRGVRDKTVSITGYAPSDSIAARGMIYDRQSHVTIRGDTVILTSNIQVQTYGERAPHRFLLTERAELPRVQ
jgi:hypothetical protein